MEVKEICLEDIQRLAQAVGLDDVGCVQAEYLEEDARFMEAWLSHYSPTPLPPYSSTPKLHYLAKNCDKRYDPRILVPGTQTIIVGVLTFEHSSHDYHRTMKSKLYALEAALKKDFGEDIVNTDYQHIFCDSAPVLERRWAQKAGLGFIGKNHAFIHPALGSLVHLGELFLNTPLPLYSSTPLLPQCGSCSLCIDACPNHVLGVEPWDVTQCIAYETNYCLICQNCCPYNKH